MQKTYKEKYLELKKEIYYLKIIRDSLELSLINSKSDFESFKIDLKNKEQRESKNFFIFSIISLSFLTVFACVGSILTAFGLL